MVDKVQEAQQDQQDVTPYSEKNEFYPFLLENGMYCIRRSGKGDIPVLLRGKYTRQSYALDAIGTYIRMRETEQNRPKRKANVDRKKYFEKTGKRFGTSKD